uniref:Uncharacterized protein n=1 Tax=Candidatus Kentrum sp. MB TaxID=2138164 RepID=A0A450XCF0_9GAMM|nr:MAG: hypothetical protein BECKMB1821G_GA0114241_102435 [Candidatus Kentron sp. MB]VFK31226.1 MAG: hypothetical protein BECKMB1821I_GA0114274_102134 [Candidatus Kentron sp. MB]VFK75401.1 MAG: hypothetical protein BECKMB1821H_GA0114242_102135 [Candidatus Kentron sp. MB]
MGYRGPLLHDQCHVGVGRDKFLIVLSKIFWIGTIYIDNTQRADEGRLISRTIAHSSQSSNTIFQWAHSTVFIKSWITVSVRGKTNCNLSIKMWKLRRKWKDALFEKGVIGRRIQKKS